MRDLKPIDLKPMPLAARADSRQAVNQTRYASGTSLRRTIRRQPEIKGLRRRGSDAFQRLCREPLLDRRSLVDASTPAHTPWKILIPHSTMTMANTSVAAVSTLSKEATLILTLRFPAPLTGLGDSLILLQSHDHNALNVAQRLCCSGHTSG
jgi:hypothetical protein